MMWLGHLFVVGLITLLWNSIQKLWACHLITHRKNAVIVDKLLRKDCPQELIIALIAERCYNEMWMQPSIFCLKQSLPEGIREVTLGESRPLRYLVRQRCRKVSRTHGDCVRRSRSVRSALRRAEGIPEGGNPGMCKLRRWAKNSPALNQNERSDVLIAVGSVKSS